MSEPITVRAGKPMNISVDATGLPPGATASFEIYEPYGLGGDPVDKVTATVDAKDPHVINAKWTYDHAKLKDKVHGAEFYMIVKAGKTGVSVTRFKVVDKFEQTLKDKDGHPLANRPVLLRPERGKPIEATTDAEGKVTAMVPPGDYRVEVVDRARTLGPTAVTAQPAKAAEEPPAVPAPAPVPESDHDDQGSSEPEEKTQVLSARFLDRTGRGAAKNVDFEVEGTKGTTDGDGKANVPKMPWRDLKVVFDGGHELLVPAVADASKVIEVRLPWLEPGDSGPRPIHDTPPAEGTHEPDARDQTPDHGDPT